MKSKKDTDYDRLSKPARPLPILRKGTEVKVFLGAGWGKGAVTDSTKTYCSVYLTQGRRTVTVRDARNIQPLKP